MSAVRSRGPRAKGILRKEVIQPQVPLRLPCYDLVPITGLTFGACPDGPSDFGCPPLWWLDGRCVQGPGTHSPRRADPRLLAIPASRRRVAARDPNWGAISAIGVALRLSIALGRPIVARVPPRA